MQKVVMIALAMLVLPGTAMAQKNKKIVCWQDEHGQRMCGDRIPPQYAKKERKVYDEKGYVVDIKSRERTAEELAEDARVAKLKAEEARKAEEQIQYDKFLLQTYEAAADIEAARDERLKSLDYRIQIGEKAVKETQATVEKLRADADAAKAGGKELDAKQKKQLRNFEKALKESGDGVAKLKTEREAVTKEFDRDIARFRELTSKTRG